MSQPKKFGVWMDTVHATVVGNNNGTNEMVVIAHVSAKKAMQNTSEKNLHEDEKGVINKYFKEIARHMQNATHLHATGTGQIQEQFLNYLADTPQFKNVKTEDSTANKMSDEKLLEFFADKIS